MKNSIRILYAIILALASIVSLWFWFNNLQPLGPGLYSFTVIFFIGLGITLKLFAESYVNRSIAVLKSLFNYKYSAIVTLFVVSLTGILVRLYFYFRFSYTGVSDTMTFYDAGVKISQGYGMLGDSYAAFLPYLATYENALGIAMRAIDSPWLAVIALNTIFDLGAAFAMYFLVKKISRPGSKLPLIAFSVWLFSPFNILFSVVSLPIIQVNFFIIVTLLIVYLLTERILKLRLGPSLLMAAVLGGVTGIGNTFRPVFIIAIVALFVMFIYIFIKNSSKAKLPLILLTSFLTVVLMFFTIQQLHLSFVARETGIKPARNSAGWSIFVGSNAATNGKWNRADEIRMGQMCMDISNGYETCHKKLQAAGLARYKSYGVTGTTSLFVRKLYVFSSNQSNVYNANLSINKYATSKFGKLMSIYTVLFLLVLFILSSRFLYMSAKTAITNRELDPIILYISLLLIGFFVSGMLVETSERYAQITYPMFIITAVLAFGLIKAKKQPK